MHRKNVRNLWYGMKHQNKKKFCESISRGSFLSHFWVELNLKSKQYLNLVVQIPDTHCKSAMPSIEWLLMANLKYL